MSARMVGTSQCEASSTELETWIEAARYGARDALGWAIASVGDYPLIVLVGHHREQLSFETIGRRRGISAEAARKRTRASGRLRKEVGPSHDPG